MNKVFTIIFLFNLSLLLPYNLISNDYYVKVTGVGNKDGSDWSNALGEVEFANKLITANYGDIFHIAAGTYYPVLDATGSMTVNPRQKTFLLKNGVVLKGGYDADGNTYTGEDYHLARATLNGDIGIHGTCTDDVYQLLTYNDNVNNVKFENIDIITNVCNDRSEKILFKEDFGGNSTSAPRVSQTPFPVHIRSDYPFSNENEEHYHPAGIYYWLFKYNINRFGSINSSKTTWHTKFDDQSSPNDTTQGYMLAVETGRNTNVFYEQEINNLCGNTRLYLSAKIANLSVKSTDTWGWEQDPNIKFELLDDNDNVIISYITGRVQRYGIDDFTWLNYGFPFIVPENVSTVKLRISNYLTTGWQEAAFVMDDIEIKFSTPPVTISANDEHGAAVSKICQSSYVTVTGLYEDNGVFGSGLTAQVEFRPTESTQWIALNTTVNKTANPINISWEVNGVNKTHEGYYRIRVGNASTPNNDACSTLSDSIYLESIPHVSLPDIRIKLCPEAAREISLSKYIDTTNVSFQSWKALSPVNPAIKPGTETTTGIVNSADFTYGTYTYEYKAAGQCNADSAKLYIATITNMGIRKSDTIVVCKESATQINLDRILGFEIMGSWVYDNTINPDNTVADNITIIQAPAINEGSHVFNGFKAWHEATSSGYLIPGGYNGDMNTKLFKIHYKIDPDNNCLNDDITTKEIIIIVTENLVN